MNYKLIFRILGRILILEAAAMLPALLVSVCYADGAAVSFLISMAAPLAVGAAMAFFIPKSTGSMRPKEGFLTVALGWIMLSLFGALPMLFSGVLTNYIDALFEIVSGFTTTGASILPYVEGLPQSILFWRSFTHWLGGMGVLILTLAILPAGERGVYNLMRAEATGPSAERIVPRLRKTALILYGIYVALTFIGTVFLLFGGMSFFDAVIHMLGTAGTGGFSNRNLSIGAYNSAYIEYTVAIFMLIFSVNFSLYFAIITFKLTQVWRNTELKLFLCIIAAGSLIITADLLIRGGFGTTEEAFRHAFFQISSLGSSTGYSSVDFALWPELSRTVLLLVMAIGACAGSTGGGFKVIRVAMLFKSAMREIKKILHPRSVNVVRLNGQSVTDKTLTGVSHYFVVYVFIILTATLLVSVDDMGFETSFTGVLSMISNTGPGFGLVGPMSNYSAFSAFSKIVLSVCMLIGRLEIFPILLLLAPSAWRKKV